MVNRSDLVVVGGGAIGLAVAWRAAQRGMSVALLERDQLGAGASHVAAGMLAPVTEAEYGPGGQRLLELSLESLRRWPPFADELARAADSPSRLRRDGMLTVAGDRDAAEALERAVAFRRSLGLEIELMRPSEARSLEPALAPRVRLAALSPIEQSVDPVWLIDALAEAARRAGAVLREGVTVAGLAESSGRVRGVRLADGEVWSGGSVVVAAGAWSGRLGTLPVRPVKGQIMRLSDPAGPGLVSRPVRFEDGYLVPRGDGRYVLGATVEERGFDATVTSGAIYELLRDAAEVVPGVLELELEDVRAGLRPGMPDNIPAIGPAPTPGLLWATGHFRNGILLTPLTAELVVGALAGESEPPLAELCSPRRFYGAEVVA